MDEFGNNSNGEVMKVQIYHQSHHSWEPLPEGQTPGPTDMVRPVHPDHPNGPFNVRRLVPSGDSVTTMEIPDDSFADSVRDYAMAQGSEPTQVHHRALLRRHIEDVVHAHHSPREFWTKIAVEGDPKLSRHLTKMLVDTTKDDEDETTPEEG